MRDLFEQVSHPIGIAARDAGVKRGCEAVDTDLHLGRHNSRAGEIVPWSTIRCENPGT